jgi:hypothetical protein
MGYTTILPEPMWDPVSPSIDLEEWEDDDE